MKFLLLSISTLILSLSLNASDYEAIQGNINEMKYPKAENADIINSVDINILIRTLKFKN